MKKGLILAMLAALVVVASADMMQAIEKQEIPYEIDANAILRPQSRIVPEFSFMIEPQDIVTTFYDYMPGSYISYPLRIQSNNDPGDNGAYIGFHATETANATRRGYYAYIEADGTVASTAYISQSDLREGYVGTALDHETQDPFFAWHVDLDEDVDYDVAMSFDMWHVLQGPGLVSTPINVLDPAVYAGVYSPADDDEFIWPTMFIVQSPTYNTDGKRRLFVIGSNYVSHSGNPSENVLIKWCDFQTSDIDNTNFANLEWTYLTFPLLDAYNMGPTWGRYNKGLAFTDDGQCALIGYLGADDIDLGNDLVIFYNDNWAEGTWEVIQTGSNFIVDMPLNQDNTPYFDVSSDIFFSFVNSSHPNARFDAEGNLHFLGNMVLGHIDDTGSHMLWAYFSYLKGVVYNPLNGDVTWQDIYPQSTNEDPTFPYLPWDGDQDGVLEYSDEGNLLNDLGWPIWWYGWDEAFHENSFKFAKGGDYMAAVWQDGLYSRFYNDAGDEDYADWATCPEIAISLSADNGVHWSEPIFMNANVNAEVGYTTEIDGMMPNYVYPGDIIEDIGEGHGKLHLFFLDDNSFGSYIQEQGANDGGTLKYAALDVDFSQLPGYGANDDGEVTPFTTSLINYPNPFNPTTNISFSLPVAQDVELKIYNVRGELVKTMATGVMPAGPHTFVWEGNNNNGSAVASGVYFCKLSAGGSVETNKMLLLK
ncbi:MAG: T9SS type A sorting domain-containing protein [Candidatus Cloacimonetes bacterium]|nr:T9SS type A sorting domain-containing protein [Candidatus Cloacimonadota bacterium]